MSCMIASPEVLSAVAEFTADVLNNGFNSFGFDAPESLSRALRDCRDPYCFFDPRKIYKRLYALNLAAYEGRYKRDYDGNGDPLDLDQLPDVDTGKCRTHSLDRPATSQPWHYRTAKLLQFYTYQIAEDATVNHPLYLALMEFQRILLSYIVTHSQPWNDAPGWGQF